MFNIFNIFKKKAPPQYATTMTSDKSKVSNICAEGYDWAFTPEGAWYATEESEESEESEEVANEVCDGRDELSELSSIMNECSLSDLESELDWND